MTQSKDQSATPEDSYAQWKGWARQDFGSFTRMEELTYLLEARRSGIRVGPDTRVLEIGFGNGGFAGWVSTRSSHFTGIEANPDLLERARSMGLEVHAAVDQGLPPALSGRQFDLVVAFDILEHLQIPAIVALMRACADSLAPAGSLLIRVPSGDSPFSGPLFHGDLTHRTLLGTKAMRQLAMLTGLCLDRVTDAAFPIRGMGLSITMRRLAIAGARRTLGKILAAVFHGNEAVVVSPNLVAVFTKPAGYP
jgi:2-polyprenyl-3-methyl-5-hydroxy-6-metoxy-1,4-benzoquinol methylase